MDPNVTLRNLENNRLTEALCQIVAVSALSEGLFDTGQPVVVAVWLRQQKKNSVLM